MRYLFLIPFFLMLMGFTQIYNTHDSFQKLDDEIKNIADSLQDQQFTSVLSSPNYQDLKDGQIVIYSSATINPTITLMLRIGTTVYVSPYWTIMKGR